MDAKAFIESVRKEINSAMTKTFDKVEELSKLSRLKLKIGSLKGDIKDLKTEMGSYIYEHIAEHKENEFLAEKSDKIQEIESMIKELEVEISALKEKGEDE
jgi:regulator of replication initiation timing